MKLNGVVVNMFFSHEWAGRVSGFDPASMLFTILPHFALDGHVIWMHQTWTNPEFRHQKAISSFKTAQTKIQKPQICFNNISSCLPFPQNYMFLPLMHLRHNLLTIMSHFVTLRSCDMNKSNIVLWSSSAPILFFIFVTFSVTWPYVTWSVTWPLSPDWMITWLSCHMTTLIVLISYCPTAHCPPYMGTLLSLGLLSHFLLFSPAIVFIPIVPRALLFISLGHLVMVAASVVYKPCLYHRRGLKPDLVSNPSVVACQTFVCLSLSHLKVPWDSPLPSYPLPNICLVQLHLFTTLLCH